SAQKHRRQPRRENSLFLIAIKVSPCRDRQIFLWPAAAPNCRSPHLPIVPRAASVIVISEISEITDITETEMNLPPLVQSFVLHFGEMGSRWGINRTVGQIY